MWMRRSLWLGVALPLTSLTPAWAQGSPTLPALVQEGAPPVAPTVGAPPEVTGLPTDVQLEAAGARIGEIQITTKDIFDLSDPADNNWVFRTADRLHIETHESAIRAQLLFRSGDLYSRRLLDETARNIRQNSNFLREPTIRPIAYHDGVVDLEVITHDVWTLQPGISFHRSGGANSSSIDFADSNFLGYGKYIELGHGEDVDRSSNYVAWADPNVWGSHWTDAITYSNNSDGTVWNATAKHPFYALETRFAGGANIGDNHSDIKRYRLGDEYDAYSDDWRVADAYFGDALLITSNWTERLIGGWHMDRSRFAPDPTKPLRAALPADRDLSYPWVRYQWIQNSYDTMRNLDLIARTEDVHFGLDASAGVGWATPSFGSDRTSLILDSEVTYGWRFGLAHELFVASRVYSRFDGGRMRDAIATGSASYYIATTRRTRLLVRVSGDAGRNFDADHYLQLGGDTGLRGYPLRYQNGNERALVTLEERLYTNWYLFRLLNIGAAAFYDMGRTWGTTPVPTPQLGLLKDAGVGLRLGNARSSFGSVIHVDLAMPLDRTGNISSLQFLVSTQQSF